MDRRQNRNSVQGPAAAPPPVNAANLHQTRSDPVERSIDRERGCGTSNGAGSTCPFAIGGSPTGRTALQHRRQVTDAQTKKNPQTFFQ
jgi:hypothetical protein